MKLKGIDKFLEKIPMLSGKKIIFLPIYVVLILTLSITIQLYFDLLPTELGINGVFVVFLTFSPVLGVLLMGIIAILLVYQMWYNRDRLKAKYGQLSYQKIILAGFGGVIIIMSMVIHNFITYYLWNPVFWSQPPFKIYVVPLTSFFPEIMLLLEVLRFCLGWFILILGIMMIVRALEVFGFDYMTVVYLYFPEESELQDHKIYSTLRHPTYSAILMLSLAGMCFQLTLYSIFNFLILYIGIYIHVHFVEEKELINRFGDSYKVYRKRTPAFFVYPRNLFQFFKFILGKK